jgi:hypothetical protein
VGLLDDGANIVMLRLPRLYYDWRDKRELKKLLNDPKWPDSRSRDRLAKEIGRDETGTKRLLTEIGARWFIMADGREGWRKRKL